MQNQSHGGVVQVRFWDFPKIFGKCGVQGYHNLDTVGLALKPPPLKEKSEDFLGPGV